MRFSRSANSDRQKHEPTESPAKLNCPCWSAINLQFLYHVSWVCGAQPNKPHPTK